MRIPRSGRGTVRAAFVVYLAGIAVSQLATAQSSVKQQPIISPVAKLEKTARSTPIFIENIGQFDPKVRFQGKIGSQTVWLTNEGVVFDTTRPAHDDLLVPQVNPSGSALEKSPLFDRAKPASRCVDRLVFSEDFVGANCCSKVEGKEPQPGVYNYFQGSDPAQWRTNVRGYAEVVYRGVWPDVDLRIYGNGTDLEQEFIVQGAGNLAPVKVAYRGIEALSVAKDGSLEINTAFGQLRETQPRIYQQISGQRIEVAGRFKLTSEKSYAFEVGTYKSEYALVIDPTLLYSTFLGGAAGNRFDSTSETATGVAVDVTGNAYISGYTLSTDFPTTPGVFRTSNPGADYNSFITKLNATGSALVYSTYLGAVTGNLTSSNAVAIAVDISGNAYVAGQGAGSSFPTTSNAAFPSCGAGNGFITVLNSVGTGLIYSSCFGFSPYPYSRIGGIALDTHGRAAIVGVTSSSIPTTPNAFQPSYPGGFSGFVMLFDTTASGIASLIYSSHFGIPGTVSNGGVSANAVAIDSFGNIYITGGAIDGLPTTVGAFQTSVYRSDCGGPCPDAFVAKFNPFASGSQSLIYSTYLGGVSQDEGFAIAVDAAGNAYVTGRTTSANFPVTPGAFQTTPPFNVGGSPAVSFVTKLNAGGSKLVYSTYFEGTCMDPRTCSSPGIQATGIVVDSLGSAYVVGSTNTPLFPVTLDAFQTIYNKPVCRTDCASAFLTKFNPAGTALIYSSYLGGDNHDVATSVAIDQTGDAYVAGHTASANFPVTGFAFQPSMKGTGDAFVAKFPLGSVQTLSISSLQPTSGGNAGTVTINIQGGGVHNGASVKLVGGSTITANAPVVGSEGRTITAVFDLTTAPVGAYALVVTNPDNTTTSLPNAFTVLKGGGSNVSLSFTGLAVNHGSDTNVVLQATIANNGKNDAAGGLLFTPANSGFTFTSMNPPSDIIDSTSGGQLRPLSATLTIPPSGISYLQNLPSGQSQTVTSTARSSTSSAAACSALWGPVCLTQDVAAVVACIVNNNAGMACLTTATACTLAAACMAGSGLTGGAAVTACLPSIRLCLGLSLNPNGACGPVAIQCIQSNASSCTSLQIPCVHAIDPNDLVGPAGIGSQQWVAGGPTLTYIIAFENIPSAPVPAQQVIVTHPLGTNVNLSTLSLLGITIPNGGTDVQAYVPAGAFNPSAGLNEYTTNVDLRPTQNLLVNVDALLNSSTQTLTWTLTSIDPATGQPPVNPLIGFLPPGTGGSMSLNVTPKQGLATGTQIVEQASILFVGASPMSTPTWTNTIDNTSPVSHVSPLPATSACPAFQVSWSGSDVGSGIQSYTIYVSDSGGPFTAWFSNTTAVTATYQGAVGHTYAFYSIATDLVGNVEAAKTTAEATTLVTSATCGSTFKISGQVTKGGTALSGVTLTLVGGAPGSTQITDGSGNFSFTNLLAGGNYTVTPTLANYTFTPPSSTFNNLQSNQTANFVATAVTYSISGQVTKSGLAFPGVTVRLSGGTIATLTTDGLGNYNISGIPAGLSYTVMPTLAYHSFSPASATFNNLQSNQTANFIGIAKPGAGIPNKVGTTYSGYSVLDANGNFAWDGPTTDKLISWSTFQSGEKPIYGDWNGDGKTKVGVYNNGTWLLDYNGNGVWDGPTIDQAIFWSTGQSSDVPVMGDWNGDGKTKIGIYNNGTWILDYNGNGVWEGPGVDKTIYWSTGQAGEVPVVGDWNGDGKTKIGIHVNGTWILEYNGNYAWDGTGVDKLIYFGGPGYRPMVGDWNGSGWTKVGAYHVNGTWALDYNGNFVWDGTSIDKLTFFGGPEWTPVVGDWSASGTTKIGAYTNGQWALDYNGNFGWELPPDKLFSFGAAGQTPIVGKW